MLIVKIHYGLGNQLFQYALSRSLSFMKKADIRLDTTFFKTNVFISHPRIYQLDQFNIEEQVATLDEIERFVNPSFLERRRRGIKNSFLEYYKQKIVYEKKLDFDPNIFIVNNNAYLFGFWQDYRYFSSIEQTLREELSFKNEPTGSNALMLEVIRSSNSISLHIRRGDYLTDGYVLDNVGVCDLGFFRDAVEDMAKSVSNPVFYFFSDDPGWVKDNFSIPYDSIYVDINSEAMAFEDLRLMSNCRHHIISNSSFSWWGAWLCNNKEKNVIAPRVWRIKGPNMFLPEGWKTF